MNKQNCEFSFASSSNSTSETSEGVVLGLSNFEGHLVCQDSKITSQFKNV